jgi:hypothetical protein
LTRSQPADAAAPAVRVVFAPGVTDSERNELLASHGLTIVEGPTSDGILTLALPPADDQAAIVAALKLDPRIRLVTSPPLSAQP